MGQKVSPTGFRLGITEDWKSRWYADNDYAETLENDIEVRRFLEKRLKGCSLSRIEIERAGDTVRIALTSARPGLIIGKKGADIGVLRKDVEKIVGKKVDIDIIEVKRPELDAQLVARSIADQLEGRVAFRRAMRKAVQSALKSGAVGIRVQCSGRLGGSEMCRREWYREGRVPLHTLRAMIDYGTATAHTKMGSCGVKVWIYYGDKMSGQGTVNPALEGVGSRRRKSGGNNRNNNKRGGRRS